MDAMLDGGIVCRLPKLKLLKFHETDKRRRKAQIPLSKAVIEACEPYFNLKPSDF